MRILSYINYLIAAVVVAAIGAGYWFVYRPQAETSGAATANVKAEVQIARDALGVPHIQAKSLDDLFFAQGYVHAQDRLFQMDGIRRQTAGDLAEVFGQQFLASDVEARRLQLRRLAEVHAAALSGDGRAALVAYARGVNHFIETHRGRLPLEFTVIGYDPTPWTLTDSMLVALSMARSLTESWQHDLAKQNMIGPNNRDMVEQLFPVRAAVDAQPGSNAWAISGRFTQSGKPLLASDPHLQMMLPGIWYENDLKAPGFHVAGVSLPGLPAIIIGHNDNIAWGMTNLQFDVQDLYLERADLAQNIVAFQGALEPIRTTEETIRIRGGALVTLKVNATHHGPLVTESTPVIGATPYQLALRWKVAEPGGLNYALLALNRAANWDEFHTALRGWTAPPQNFIYADTAGNIGYQVAGNLPNRPNHSGDLPVDGASGNFEWDGSIPFDDLPSVYNPPSGHVITSNQNPFPADYKYRVNGTFAPPDRARQIEARLSKKAKLSAADMMSIQRDLYSSFHHFLAQQLVAAAKGRSGTDPNFTESIRLLSTWDGRMSPDSAAAVLTAMTWTHLRQAIVERAAPGKSTSYDYPMSSVVAERLLRERPAIWFQDFDQILVRALLDALADGNREQGSGVANWRLGLHQAVTIRTPVLGSVSLLRAGFSGWLQIGPEEMGGASTTVNQYTRRAETIAPSMRMVVDLGNLDALMLTLLTGQSGQVLSRHFTDQWPAYRDGVGNPFPFNKVDAPSVLRLLPR